MYRLFPLQAGILKRIFTWGLASALVIFGFVLLNPPPTTAQDRRVEPEGNAQSDIFVWLPEGAVDLPVLITADYQAEEELPEGMTYPSAAIGRAFSFGIWKGEDTSLKRFDSSIVITIEYHEEEVTALTSGAEERLQLLMYDPAIKAWVQTCSSVDVYLNTISASLAAITPFEQDGGNLEGSALLAMAVSDDASRLTQAVDKQGMTTISPEGSGMSLEVPPGTVEPGTHFEITVLPNVSGTPLLRLLDRPANVKACNMDYLNPSQGNRQIDAFSKPLQVVFNYDLDALSRAGGRANLTVAELRDSRWIDLEELGFRVIRSSGYITVDTNQSGTFSLAAR